MIRLYFLLLLCCWSATGMTQSPSIDWKWRTKIVDIDLFADNTICAFGRDSIFTLSADGSLLSKVKSPVTVYSSGILAKDGLPVFVMNSSQGGVSVVELTKTNLNGEGIWKTTLTEPGYTLSTVNFQSPKDLLLLSDGSLLLQCSAWNNLLNRSAGGYVARIAPDGNKLWSLLLNHNMTVDGRFGDLRQSAEVPGGFIVTGTYTAPPQGGRGWLIKLNQEGVVQWEKMVTTPAGNDLFYGVTALTDGNLLAVGAQGYSINLGTLMYKFTPEGQQIWMRTGEKLESFLAVTGLPDGRYLAGGVNSTTAHGKQLLVQGTEVIPAWRETFEDGSFIKLKDLGAKGFLALTSAYDLVHLQSVESNVIITNTENPDKRGCETGKLSFRFNSGESWTYADASLLSIPAPGTPATIKTIRLSYPLNVHTFTDLKAGKYQVAVKTSEEKSYYSSTATLEDPDPSAEIKLNILATYDADKYGCATGKVDFSFQSPDCWKPATISVTPVERYADGALPVTSISDDASRYTLRAIPAGQYKLLVKDKNGDSHLSEIFDIRQPDLDCKELSVSAFVDDSEYEKNCTSKVTLTLDAKGYCPTTWYAELGAGRSATTIEAADILKSSTNNSPPGQPIIFHPFKLWKDLDASWFGINMEVKFGNYKTCRVAPVQTNVQPIEKCKYTWDNIKIEIMKAPSSACAKDGIVRFTLLTETCQESMRYGTTEGFEVILQDPDGVTHAGKTSGKTVTIENLPAITFDLSYAYHMANYQSCGGLTKPFTLAPATGSAPFCNIWPNPSVGQTFVNYEINSCGEQTDIVITDSKGVRLRHEVINKSGKTTGTISISSLPAGFYTIFALSSLQESYKTIFFKL